MQQEYTAEQVDSLNSESLIAEMVANQDALNSKAYNLDWLTKGASREFDYPLAAAQEIAEFINSYGYSWWSKPLGNMVTAPLDESNCRTEIVDAVHFMLSQSIIDESISGATASIHIAYLTAERTNTPFNTRELARLLSARLMVSFDAEVVENTAMSNPWVTLFLLCRSMGFSLEHLYARYMGKSTLNAFRQKHGYKEGRYQKLWDGKKEDNYFLAQWIDGLTEVPTVRDVEHWLDQEYAKHQAASTA